MVGVHCVREWEQMSQKGEREKVEGHVVVKRGGQTKKGGRSIN